MPYKDPIKRKEKQRGFNERHYTANKQEYIDRARAHDAVNRRRNASFLFAYKTFMGCKNCGIADARVLDCHHLSDKQANIGTIWRTWSLRRLVDELAKCIILCANCHRIETCNIREADLRDSVAR